MLTATMTIKASPNTRLLTFAKGTSRVEFDRTCVRRRSKAVATPV
jgi:hypothetical protein